MRSLFRWLALATLPIVVACAQRDACPAGKAQDPETCARDGCPRFAFGSVRSPCACGSGSALVAAGCVALETADAYCGRGARYVGGACVFRDCPDGERLDLSGGQCLPARALRDIAAVEHVAIYPGETLACTGDRAPVIEGGHASCIPEEATCPRGTQWRPGGEKTSCVRLPACAAGEAMDPSARRCVRLLVDGASSSGVPSTESYRVDVARWLLLEVGPSGGAGVASFCSPIAARPGTFGVPPRSSMKLRVSVELVFPDNDVTQVSARVAGQDLASTRVLAGEAARALDEATRPLVEGIRALGGEATVGVSRTTVQCTIESREAPSAVALPVADAGPP